MVAPSPRLLNRDLLACYRFVAFASCFRFIASWSHVSGMMKNGVRTSPRSMLIQTSPM